MQAGAHIAQNVFVNGKKTRITLPSGVKWRSLSSKQTHFDLGISSFQFLNTNLIDVIQTFNEACANREVTLRVSTVD
jgi:hypothetical protein